MVDDKPNEEPAPKRKKKTDFWAPFRFLKATNEERLRGSVLAFRKRIRARIDSGTITPESLNWLTALTPLLNEADEAADRSDVDTGWRCLHAARRLETYTYSEEDTQAEAVYVKKEAEKLSGNRKEAIKNILEKMGPDRKMLDPTAADLRAALEIRDEHYANVYFKIGMVRNQLTLLAYCFAITFFLILMGFMCPWGPVRIQVGTVPSVHGMFVAVEQEVTPPADTARGVPASTDDNPVGGSADSLVDTTGGVQPDSLAGRKADTTLARISDSLALPAHLQYTQDGFKSLVLGVVLFGLLGAIFSAAFSLMGTATTSTIPEQVANFSVTFMRVALGPAAALVVYMSIRSEFAPDMITKNIVTPAGFYLIAFAAGFTERLVKRAVKSAGGGK